MDLYGYLRPALVALLTLAPLRWCAAQESQSGTFPEADQALKAVFAEIAAEQARFAEEPKTGDREWVKRRLAHLYEVDQKARGAYMRPRPETWSPAVRDYYGKKLANRIIALDRAHTEELKQLLKAYGWFKISEFGEKADMHGWVLVQHADRDPEFQKEVLLVLGSLYRAGETSANNFANLFDRVARNSGKLQRYGTQGSCVAPGKWEPFESEDPAGLDQRRASVGLSSMAEYLQRSRDLRYCP